MKLKIGTTIMATVFMAVGAQADSFGSGANAFSLDFVNIGNAGNAADSSGYGAVADDYRMGMYEVTIDQFAKANAAAGGTLGDGDENPYSGGVNRAASRTSWLEAAKFANYLTSGTYNGGAYQFSDVNTLTGVDRDAAVSTFGTVYVLPTEDEWYKAAYYKPVNDGSYSLYANGDGTVAVPGTAPTHGTSSGWNYYDSGYAVGPPDYIWDVGFGAEEQNGTFDMNGNVWEWNESAWDGTLDNMAESRVIRGGAFNSHENTLRSFFRYNSNPTFEDDSLGFRVAAIPEPSSIAMVGVVSGLGLFIRRKFRR